MKLLGLVALVLLLAALLAPVGHGARQRADCHLGGPPLAPVQIIRSRGSFLAPKTVRTVPSQVR
ncbi:hypothetical protein FNT36_15560 [Hymenobacter setariae]|uniref:Uncharacterized protein n=1 Tax=Hymenobacter setariae TaxID=2594794 RepID=A0A558BRE3_9BACT|nr:hypothetical protein [Hymenobacter setariae]TVT39079.1 hypothetical protein FNT36_15560 [Hymenobacter setariae]